DAGEIPDVVPVDENPQALGPECGDERLGEPVLRADVAEEHAPAGIRHTSSSRRTGPGRLLQPPPLARASPRRIAASSFSAVQRAPISADQRGAADHFRPAAPMPGG